MVTVNSTVSASIGEDCVITTNARPDDEQEYQPTAAYEWTERAYQLLVDGQLHGRAFATGAVLSSHVWGPCPRCEHPLDDRQVHTAVVSGVGRWPGGPDQTGEVPSALEVDVACGCGYPHPRAPQGVAGCGVSFRVELVLAERS
jgi:hypothetical protein